MNGFDLSHLVSNKYKAKAGSSSNDLAVCTRVVRNNDTGTEQYPGGVS